VSDTNDIVGSMGIRFRKFTNIPTPGSTAFAPANGGISAVLPDSSSLVTDPIPIFQGIRRVEPRNTPTVINSALNYDNFWDGRGRHDFNGGSVFGASDPQSHVIVDSGGQLQKTRQLIRFASVASQMTGPALSDFEMSFQGRSWPVIAKKLLQGDGSASRPNVTPLANQLVSTSDSVLGPFSNQGGSWCQANGRTTAANRPGLCLNYREIIQQAYFPQLWTNTTQHLNRVAAVCTSGAHNGVLSPAGCDPFDGVTLAIANGASAPTTAAVHADGSQFHAFRRAGPAGLHRNAGFRRHALRPIPGSKSPGIQGAQWHCDPTLFRNQPAEHAAMPDRGRRLRPQQGRRPEPRTDCWAWISSSGRTSPSATRLSAMRAAAAATWAAR
jgi:hypothetical protein